MIIIGAIFLIIAKAFGAIVVLAAACAAWPVSGIPRAMARRHAISLAQTPPDGETAS